MPNLKTDDALQERVLAPTCMSGWFGRALPYAAP